MFISALFTAHTKHVKRHLLAETESASHSARLLFLFQIFFMYTVVSQNWSQTILFLLQIDKLYILFILKTAYVACMRHLFWVMIKIASYFNVKSTNKALFYLHEDINFIFGTYLFDLVACFKNSI